MSIYQPSAVTSPLLKSPELLELIFLNLPPLTLLRSIQFVHPIWYQVIKTSPSIKYITWQSNQRPSSIPPTNIHADWDITNPDNWKTHIEASYCPIFFPYIAFMWKRLVSSTPENQEKLISLKDELIVKCPDMSFSRPLGYRFRISGSASQKVDPTQTWSSRYGGWDESNKKVHSSYPSEVKVKDILQSIFEADGIIMNRVSRIHQEKAEDTPKKAFKVSLVSNSPISYEGTDYDYHNKFHMTYYIFACITSSDKEYEKYEIQMPYIYLKHRYAFSIDWGYDGNEEELHLKCQLQAQRFYDPETGVVVLTKEPVDL